MVQGLRPSPAWSQQHPDVAVLAAGNDGQVWQNTAMAQQLQA